MVSKRKKSNRFEMLNYFQASTQRYLTKSEALTWFNLWAHAKPRKGDRGRWCCSIGQRQFAEELGSDRRTVRRTMEKLRQLGLVVLEKDGRNRWQASRFLVYPNVDETRRQWEGNIDEG